MTFNWFMHPRNIYRTRPDFKQLASDFPEFSEYTISDERDRVHVNFKDARTLRCLTKTLLKKDFGLEISIPENCLIPTVPQRLNYILWLEDLLELLQGNGTVRGIDVGTGPCCIFPVLGAKKNGWRFLATEAQEQSLNWAMKNVADNNLQEQIELRKVDKDVILKGVLDEEMGSFEFCMCNPPFFHDLDEMMKGKRSQDVESMDVKLDEVVVQGGEVQFVKKMIVDSTHLGEKVSIYTSMLGKKRSVHPIKTFLKGIDGLNFTFTEFCQGNTLRWGVAWTFIKDLELGSASHPKRKKKKKPMNFLIPKTEEGYTIKTMQQRVVTILKELSIQYEVKNQTRLNVLLLIMSDQNTWSRQRQKRRKAMRLGGKDGVDLKPEGLELDSEATGSSGVKVLSDSEENATGLENMDADVAGLEKDCKNRPDTKLLEGVKVDASLSSICSLDLVTSLTVKTRMPSFENGSKDVGVKRVLDKDDHCPAKRAKVTSDGTRENWPASYSSADCRAPLLLCNLELKRHCDKIMLQVDGVNENCNRQSMSEVLQHLKNRLCS